jgi:hypothetical protein
MEKKWNRKRMDFFIFGKINIINILKKWIFLRIISFK